MAKLGVTAGERAAGMAGAVLAVVVLLVCIDLFTDGALLGWLSSPAPAADVEGESEST
jgi:predicted PurR-regulated permease PerM